MKPSQSPSFRQIVIYDISTQRFAIYAIFIVVPSLCLSIYGLLGEQFIYAMIGLAGLLITFLEVARLVMRFRFFQKIYENGQAIRITLEDVTQRGDEISVDGQYVYETEEYFFSTTLQKTGRTKNLNVGDQVWLVIDREHPQNAYFQDLFTPDSPEEIRQPISQIEKRQIPSLENAIGENDTDRIRIKVSVPAADSHRSEETQTRKLIVRDFPPVLLVLGIIVILTGIFLYVRLSESREIGIIAGVIGLLMISVSLGSTLTITIDKDAELMRIKSIWKHNAIEIPLNDLLDIQVEVSESDDGGATYRLVAIKTNGTVIPFRDSYTSGLSSYKKRAVQLCNFIGLGNNKTQKRRQR